MAEDGFETLLKAWGRVYGEGRGDDTRSDWGPREPLNPIAVAMRFAPGKKVSRATKTLGRDGAARRHRMGEAVGIEGLHVVPAGFVDPVPCRETRGSSFGFTSRPVPPELQRVERAALALYEADFLRGLCLRVQYCTRGDREEKAQRVTDRLREVSKAADAIKPRRFTDELALARAWMHGRIE